jgi:hypothetical protein
MKYFYAIIKKNYKMRQSKENDPNYEGREAAGGGGKSVEGTKA